METRRFGRTEWQVSELGYGMSGMGYWTESDDERAGASLDKAVEAGCNFSHRVGVWRGHSETLPRGPGETASFRKIDVASKFPDES